MTMTAASPTKANRSIIGENDEGGGEDGILNTSMGSTLSGVGMNLDIAESGDFEALMKERTRIRKEREHHSVAELKVRIQRLEDGLVGETKRRVKAIDALETKTKQLIKDMEEKLLEKIESQNTFVDERLTNLENRIDELEIKFDVSSQEQIHDIESSKKELKTMIDDIKANVNDEKKKRLLREEALLKQIELHKEDFEGRYNSEKDGRNESISKIQHDIITNQKLREKQSNEFQNKISKELKLLTKELKKEVSDREEQDEEIIVALNKYTQQLQHSLNILSGE